MTHWRDAHFLRFVLQPKEKIYVARKYELNIWDEYQDDLDNEEVEEMDVGEKYRIRKRFKNQLMESEWLVDVPSDLSTNYIMVPVPTGRRSFIIAGYGTTCHYSR